MGDGSTRLEVRGYKMGVGRWKWEDGNEMLDVDRLN